MTFESLNVRPEIVKALSEEGIIKPTVIQEKTIPLANKGKDVIGISRTGSGKTAAFSIPILEQVQPRKGMQAIVLAPTRELAVQISNEIQKFGKYLKFKVATVFGGVAIGPQMDAIARSEIVVGTPGRILDHLERGTLNLSKISCFVLDEADKMVEMGFIEDIERILSCAPNDRQILLFGATISNEVEHIKRAHMHDPQTLEAETHVKKDLLKQFYYNVMPHQKFSLLVHLLKKEEMGRVMIFCSTRSTVELINNNLRNNGIKSEMIHGKMTQNKRLSVIERFNKGKHDILVASAVAARGLDIRDVTHIFNYDLSRDPQEYIHRVGRTARAGASGKAITLLGPKDHDAFNAILRRYPVDIKELPLEKFERLRFDTQHRRSPGGRFGHRRGFGDRDNRSFGRGSNRSGNDRPFRSHNSSSEGRPSRFNRSNDNRSGSSGSFRSNNNSSEGRPSRFNRSGNRSNDNRSGSSGSFRSNNDSSRGKRPQRGFNKWNR